VKSKRYKLFKNDVKYFLVIIPFTKRVKAICFLSLTKKFTIFIKENTNIYIFIIFIYIFIIYRFSLTMRNIYCYNHNRLIKRNEK